MAVVTPGTKLGVYEIIGAIGVGGMGTVYRARDTRLPREVAIKVSARRRQQMEMLAAIDRVCVISKVSETNTGLTSHAADSAGRTRALRLMPDVMPTRR